MTPAELAEIHGACFKFAPRPWTAAEMESLLLSPNVKLFQAAQGFALCQIAGPEAELLTIAVHPDSRRRGIASDLLSELHDFVKKAGVEEVFLEVSVENLAAQALYSRHGYSQKAVRKDYYDGPNGKKIGALVMSRAI